VTDRRTVSVNCTPDTYFCIGIADLRPQSKERTLRAVSFVACCLSVSPFRLTTNCRVCRLTSTLRVPVCAVLLEPDAWNLFVPLAEHVHLDAIDPSSRQASQKHASMPMRLSVALHIDSTLGVHRAGPAKASLQVMNPKPSITSARLFVDTGNTSPSH